MCRHVTPDVVTVCVVVRRMSNELCVSFVIFTRALQSSAMCQQARNQCGSIAGESKVWPEGHLLPLEGFCVAHDCNLRMANLPVILVYKV